VHRLLGTLLARCHAVQSHSTGRYLLDFKLAKLAGVVNERTDRLRTLACPHPSIIQQAIGESASVSVLAPPNALYIEQVGGDLNVRPPGPQPDARAGRRIGTEQPYRTVARYRAGATVAFVRQVLTPPTSNGPTRPRTRDHLSFRT
jgi:hypothetical protein